MYTLYQRTEEVFDLAGQSVGWQSKPVLFPDTFFLFSGLKFDWDEYTVEYKKKVYEFEHLLEIDSNVPKPDDWLSVYGNSIIFTYYTGKTDEYQDNPSGNTNNVNKMYYKRGVVDHYIIKHKYDKENHCIVRQSLEPEYGVATVNTNGYTTQIANKEQDLEDLLFVPNYGVSIEEQDNEAATKKVAVKQQNNCVFISHNANMYPVITDALIMGETDGKMIVRYTNKDWTLKVVAYNSDYVVVMENTVTITPESEEIQPVEILNNNNINYVALVFSHKNGELPSIGDITYEGLGLSVEIKKWRKLTFVNYDANNNDKTEQYITGETITLDNPTKDGYEFLGWFSSDDEANVTPVKSFTITTDMSVYARWKQKAVIHLGYDGVNSKDINFYVGDTVTKDALNTYITIPQGHTFKEYRYGTYSQPGNIVTFPMTLNTNDKSIIAVFAKNTQSGGGESGQGNQEGGA